MSDWAVKRFWTDVTDNEGETGLEVLLGLHNMVSLGSLVWSSLLVLQSTAVQGSVDSRDSAVWGVQYTTEFNTVQISAVGKKNSELSVVDTV